MGLVDYLGNMIGGGPRKEWSKWVDPHQKIFEGPVSVKFWTDRLEVRGNCFHCRSKIDFCYLLSKADARAAETDHQYRKNLFQLCAERLENDHQCVLLDQGKETVAIFFGQAGKR